MRREATPQERLLWGALRGRRFASFKFRRQIPIGPFIADFVCYDAKLIVELDGSQHIEDPGDRRRDAELERRGFRVLRICNNELLRDEASVLEAIWQALARPTHDGDTPSPGAGAPPSPTRGEGDPASLAVWNETGTSQSAPSPLVGEGARRADEGKKGRQK